MLQKNKNKKPKINRFKREKKSKKINKIKVKTKN